MNATDPLQIPPGDNTSLIIGLVVGLSLLLALLIVAAIICGCAIYIRKKNNYSKYVLPYRSYMYCKLFEKKNDVCYIMYYHQFWGVDLLSEMEGGGACGSLNICHYVINIALKVYVHILRKAIFFITPHAQVSIGLGVHVSIHVTSKLGVRFTLNCSDGLLL